ncbi:chromatin modification- protein VID21, partial [Rhizopus stolonifer]
MDWHWAEDKSTVCVKTHIPQPIQTKDEESMDIDIPETATMNMDHQGPELIPDALTSQEPIKEDVMMGAESMDDEPKTPTTPVAPHIIQEYRQILKDADPNLPLLTLSSDSFSPDVLFPDLLLYEPPRPEYNDVYFNELEYNRVTPISKSMTKPMTLKTRKRYVRKQKANGEPVWYPEEDKPEAEWLPRFERYDTTPLVSPLFAQKKPKDLTSLLPVQPEPPLNREYLSPPQWSEEDDICLISCILQFSFNWELVADSLNSVRLPVTGEKKTSFDCHERWRRQGLTSVTGQVSNMYASRVKKELTPRKAQPPTITRFDSPQKRQRQYNLFEAIKKTQRKRDELVKSTAATAAPPPRSTIETHGLSSTGQRLPSAMEMSLHKTQRERQMAQAVLEQRQLSAAISLGSQTPN